MSLLPEKVGSMMVDFLVRAGAVIFWLFLGLLLLIIAVSLGHHMRLAATSRYWIETSTQTYYTDSYTEKDGCIYFDTYYGSIKQCGFYSVIDKGER